MRPRVTGRSAGSLDIFRQEWARWRSLLGSQAHCVRGCYGRSLTPDARTSRGRGSPWACVRAPHRYLYAPRAYRSYAGIRLYVRGRRRVSSWAGPGMYAGTRRTQPQDFAVISSAPHGVAWRAVCRFGGVWA